MILFEYRITRSVLLYRTPRIIVLKLKLFYISNARADGYDRKTEIFPKFIKILHIQSNSSKTNTYIFFIFSVNEPPTRVHTLIFYLSTKNYFIRPPVQLSYYVILISTLNKFRQVIYYKLFQLNSRKK
jgi:hypothetical protein